MRILFITTEAFIPYHFSGPARSLLELGQHLVQCGHEPIVACHWTPAANKNEVIYDHSYGFPVYRADSLDRSLDALVVTLRPDIAVIIGMDGAEKFSALLLRIKMPTAVWLYAITCHNSFDSLLESGICCIATSDFVAGFAKRLFAMPVDIVPPFIRPDVKSEKIPGDCVLFINPTRRKGAELVLSLARERPKRRFLLVESGKMNVQWRKRGFELATRCGNIDWQHANLDMNGFYRRARILLAPSICEEGFCRSVTEAQRHGIPVLASNRGYLANNVGPGGMTLDITATLDDWLRSLDELWDRAECDRELTAHVLQHAFRSELDTQIVTEKLITVLGRHIEAAQQKRTFT